MLRNKRIYRPKLGVSCSAGMLVDFVYDSGCGHAPCHAAVKGGPRVGLCGTKPSHAPSTCGIPDGGLCHACEKQAEKVDGVWRVKEIAPARSWGTFVDAREDHYADD